MRKTEKLRGRQGERENGIKNESQSEQETDLKSSHSCIYTYTVGKISI